MGNVRLHVLAFAVASLPGLALAQPGPNRLPGPWHLDIEANTDFPLDIGARAQLELPYRFVVSTSLGVMPTPYAQAIDATLVGFDVFPQVVGNLINVALDGSLVWRTHVGWRPFPRWGFDIQAGYGLVALGGSAGAAQLLTAVGRAPPNDPDINGRPIHIASMLNMLDIEVGWTFLIAQWVPVRVALGFAGTLGASSSLYFVGPDGNAIQPRAAATQGFINQTTQWLDGEYQSYVFLGVISVAAGFRAF